MTLPPVFTFDFWFSTNPLPFSLWAERIILVLTVALTVLAIIGLVFAVRGGWGKRERRVLQDSSWNLLWIGLVGLLLYGFSYERIPVLSMRAFWVAWLAWLVWAVWSSWKKMMVDLPLEQQRNDERERLAKWMPKKK